MRKRTTRQVEIVDGMPKHDYERAMEFRARTRTLQQQLVVDNADRFMFDAHDTLTHAQRTAVWEARGVLQKVEEWKRALTSARDACVEQLTRLETDGVCVNNSLGVLQGRASDVDRLAGEVSVLLNTVYRVGTAVGLRLRCLEDAYSRKRYDRQASMHVRDCGDGSWVAEVDGTPLMESKYATEAFAWRALQSTT